MCLHDSFAFSALSSLTALTFGFAGLSTWTCVSPRIVVAFIAPLAFFFIIFFAILDHPTPGQKYPNAGFAGVRYSALDDRQKKRETSDLNMMEKFVVM